MPKKYEFLVDNLLDWYDENRRILPWREDPKPYYVWVSEIMLQQTRVEAVKGYFTRFMEALPTIQHLAKVPEDRLMKLWEGLGYYNRVRNLQKAAQMVVNEYHGQLPQDYEELLKLPGIGSYTAGAIASIAYNKKVPAVDGNVLRITKRVEASYDDITKARVVKEVEQDLLLIMPNRAGDFNQSLMDLGATICLPNGKPLCHQCPVQSYCKAFEKKIVMELPVKPGKKPRKLENKTVLVLEYQNRYAIRKRPSNGLLAKLWELPNINQQLSPDELEEYLLNAGVSNFEIELLGKAKHVFSHVEWHMLGYKIKLNEIISVKPSLEEETLLKEDMIWVTNQELQSDYALPNAFDAYKTWQEEGH